MNAIDMLIQCAAHQPLYYSALCPRCRADMMPADKFYCALCGIKDELKSGLSETVRDQRRRNAG